MYGSITAMFQVKNTVQGLDETCKDRLKQKAAEWALVTVVSGLTHSAGQLLPISRTQSGVCLQSTP